MQKTQKIYKPYVYIIKNKTTNLKYIGVRFAATCYVGDIFETYFTSSQLVKNLISIYGKDDFITRVLFVGGNSTEAILHEKALLDRVVGRIDYLNLSRCSKMGDEESDYINRVKIGRLSGLYTYKNGLGLHGGTPEERSAWGTIGAIASNDMKRKYETNMFDIDWHIENHKKLKKMQVSAYYDPTLRHGISSKGGKVGAFTKACYINQGFTEEDAIERVRILQSNNGKKGGRGNIGFRFYIDNEEKTRKYTAEMQKDKSFEDFMNDNKKFRPGRLKPKVKKIWANDGTNNTMVSEEDIHKRNLIKGRLGNNAKYGNRYENKENN